MSAHWWYGVLLCLGNLAFAQLNFNIGGYNTVLGFINLLAAVVMAVISTIDWVER